MKALNSQDVQASEQDSRTITVLGGGPAGLAVGYYANKNGFRFKIYEASADVGGMCRTLHYKDFAFDMGAHRLHDKNPEITQELKALLGADLKKVNAPSQIYYQQKLIDFPLSPLNLLLSLGAVTSIKAALEVVQARLTTQKDIKNFQQLALRNYGKTIAHKFLLNYSEKLWGIPCDQLSPSVSGNRLKGLNLAAFVKEAMGFLRTKNEHLDGSFYYPEQGIGQIIDALAAFCDGSIARGSKVTKLTHNYSQVTAIEINHEQRIKVDEVASTLPLTMLIKLLDPSPPQEILEIAQSLKYRSLILVTLFLNKPSISKNASIYFPEPDYVFTRIYEPKNRSRAMAPPDKTSLVVEIPCLRGDPVWQLGETELIQKVVDQLSGIGYFSRQEVCEAVCHKVEWAYPILEIGYEDKIQVISKFLSRFENLRVSGRNGKFLYTHIHDMMQFGKDINEAYRWEALRSEKL